MASWTTLLPVRCATAMPRQHAIGFSLLLTMLTSWKGAAVPVMAESLGSQLAEPYGGSSLGTDHVAATDPATVVAEAVLEPKSMASLGLHDSALNDVMEGYAASQVAATIVGVLLIINSIHDAIQRAFRSMAGLSSVAVTACLGAFCWTFLSAFWFQDLTILAKFDQTTALWGLFATTCLLSTPLLLFMPNQEIVTETIQRVFDVEVYQQVQDRFDAFKMMAAWLYIALFFMEVVSALPVFVIAQAIGSAMKENLEASDQATHGGIHGLGQASDETGPYMVTLLYLLLTYCNLCIVYERFFGVSFKDDFPQGTLARALGETSSQKPESSCQQGADQAAQPRQLAPRARDLEMDGKELAAYHISMARMGNNFVTHADTMVSLIDASVKRLHALGNWVVCLHYGLYVAYLPAEIVLISFVLKASIHSMMPQATFSPWHSVLVGVSFVSLGIFTLYWWIGALFGFHNPLNSLTAVGQTETGGHAAGSDDGPSPAPPVMLYAAPSAAAYDEEQHGGTRAVEKKRTAASNDLSRCPLCCCAVLFVLVLIGVEVKFVF